MKINIKATNLVLTPALQEYIEMKFRPLEHFLGKWEIEDVVETWIEVARTTKHHHSGKVFSAEADLKLPGKILRASCAEWNIRIAVDKARDRLRQEIKKYKELLQIPDSKKTTRRILKLKGKE